MYRKIVLALIVLVALGGHASAWKEPEDFRGVPWGASEAEAKTKYPGLSCGDPDRDTFGDRACLSNFSIGDVPVQGLFFFRADKFVRVGLTFDRKQFDTVVMILTERYGAPTREDAALREWEGERVLIELRKDDRRGGSGARIELKDDQAEVRRILKERRKKEGKDL